MIATYSEAHRRRNHILEFFFVGCAGEILVGAIHQNWWFAAVWLAAGFIDGLIVISVSHYAVTTSPHKNDEFANELAANDDEPEPNELADQCAFGGKFLRFTNLLAATVLAAGFALGNPWWGNLLAAAVTWFASMFGIPLLCAPRKNGERDAVD